MYEKICNSKEEVYYDSYSKRICKNSISLEVEGYQRVNTEFHKIPICCSALFKRQNGGPLNWRKTLYISTFLLLYRNAEPAMSDVESEVTDAAENPNPEADILANETVQNVEAAPNVGTPDEVAIQQEGDFERDDVNINAVNQNEEPEGSAGIEIDQPENADVRNENSEINEDENQSGLLAEGDQHRLTDRNDNEQGNDVNNCNSLDAEDEQYLIQEPAGCENALLDLENEIGDIGCQGAASSVGDSIRTATNGKLFEEADRTESCSQLEEYACAGNGSNTDSPRQDRVSNRQEVEDVEGASASAEGEFLKPESEADEKVSDSGANGSYLENEPTESDQEGEEASSGFLAQPENIRDQENIIQEVDSPEDGAANNPGQHNTAETNDTSDNVENNQQIPEDEISVLNTNQEPVADSYEPECDQSDLDVQTVEDPPSQGDRELCSNIAVTESVSNSFPQSPCKETEADERENIPDCSDRNLSDSIQLQAAVSGDKLNLSKDKGAIPKHRKMAVNKSNDIGATSCDNRSLDSLDSAEDELLNELDATLRNEPAANSMVDKDEAKNSGEHKGETNVENGDNSSHVNCAIGNKNDGHTDKSDSTSCEQCFRNNLKCSFKTLNRPEDSRSNGHTVSELKGQLKQANQMLMERECEINRY